MSKALRPIPVYNDALPIIKHRQHIIDSIINHQVIVICGETGSGKTTQLPKLCLDAGRGINGMIAHTQPRRIAARAVAEKIATELGSETGRWVGFKVRHTDKTDKNNCIQLMTDGILLSELKNDQQLSAYDTIIIDEAHERNLNIDFLFGYLKRLLLKRKALKLIITSATLDVAHFSAHFDHAPIVEVSGRQYPIEIRYFPAADEAQESNRNVHLFAAIEQLTAVDSGDILVFMTGESEIHEAAKFLQRKNMLDTAILPVYARLDVAKQQRLFLPHQHRHIILATNVAETSLTIPGVRHVIDSGYARISRYSYRSKIQRLPVEKISRASANQRAGRCGRIGTGICIRLYSEQDFETRAEFTEPEIVRTNLAAVILQMHYMALGDIDDFPFINPPDRRFINDGKRLLKELNAINSDNHLTETGKKLAQLPVDPRHGRILIAGHQLNCLQEISIIISALSIQDPRERPADRMTKAAQRHAKFNDVNSDFIWFVNFWKFYHQQAKALSNGKLKALCRHNFVSYTRMREWTEIRNQLIRLCTQLNMTLNRQPAHYRTIHKALIHGFLSHIAFKSDTVAYSGARNLRLYLFPGSTQYLKKPKWVVASDLVETSRLYARNVAKIDSKWIVQPAKNLIDRRYTDPYWNQAAGKVYTSETARLYGMTLYSGRKTDYGSINRQQAQDVFIREALLSKRLSDKVDFLQKNFALLAKLNEIELKKRRRYIINEAAIFDFYKNKLPSNVYDRQSFLKWARNLDNKERDALILSEKEIANQFDSCEVKENFPEKCRLGDVMLDLNYEFKPATGDDGINLTVPLHLLTQLDEATTDYLVPGIIEEKIYCYLKSLPKKFRKLLMPLPESAKKCAAGISNNGMALKQNIMAYFFITKGIKLPEASLNSDHIPDHLNINYCVIDAQNRLLANGRDLPSLKKQLRFEINALFDDINTRCNYEREVCDWDFGVLDDSVFIEVNGEKIKGYPALAKQNHKVYLRLFDSADQAKMAMHAGLQQLFIAAMDKDFRYLRKNIPDIAILKQYYSKIGDTNHFFDGFACLVVAAAFTDESINIRSKEAFEKRCAAGRSILLYQAVALSQLLKRIFELHDQIGRRLEKSNSDMADEISRQLSYLIYDGFLTDIPLVWLRHYPRYFTAIERRLDRSCYASEKQDAIHRQLAIHWKRLCYMLDNYQRSMLCSGRFETYRWMIEELRVSLFAQQLKTAMPVSIKRLEKQWQLIEDGHNEVNRTQ